MRTRVLLSVRAEEQVENPYITLFERSLDRHCEVSRFTWRRALFGRYEVFHVHWPETLIRGDAPRRAPIYKFVTLLLLIRLRRRRVPLVRTVHNIEPHESSSWSERVLLRMIDRATTARVYMNRSRTFDARSFNYLIPHGDYVSWFGGVDLPPTRDGLIFFGRLRAYKGLDVLLAAFSSVDDPDLRLAIVGRPEDDGTEASLWTAASQDARLTLRLGRASHEALADAVTHATAAVFPYASFYNSGAVLTALSLRTPVIVPLCAASEELLAEMGPDWVICYSPPLDAAGLISAAERVRARPAEERPAMTGRDWDDQAVRLASIYRQLVELSSV